MFFVCIFKVGKKRISTSIPHAPAGRNPQPQATNLHIPHCMKLLLIITTLLITLTATAQLTQQQVLNNNAAFNQAKLQYLQRNYSLAYPIFKALQQQQIQPINATAYTTPNYTSELTYYTISCELLQNDSAAATQAQAYIISNTNTPLVQLLSYQLANYYIAQQNYTAAIPLYVSAGNTHLSNTQVATATYNLGYSYFTQNNFAQAKPLLYTISNLEGDANYLNANYYYGFILFAQANYKAALTNFKRVEQHPYYKVVVPFYIAQGYYFTNQQAKALTYAEDVLNRPNVSNYYELELRQFVGHIHYTNKDFAKALPYLQQYVQQSTKVRREDLYELAYCYHNQKQYYKSIEGLKQLSGTTDSLSQNSMYLLADAYLKTNQKANARTAFGICATNSSNPSQMEIATFNYAKLSYELGYTNVVLKELPAFITKYPTSNYNTEAKDILTQALLRSNNYKEAQLQLETIPNPSAALTKLLPSLYYGRAMENITDLNYTQAETLLQKIITTNTNPNLTSSAKFWLMELAQLANNCNAAISYGNQYLQPPTFSNKEVNTTNAKYTIAYAYYNQAKYTEALPYFEAVVASNSNANNVHYEDAYIRTADCYYIASNFLKAITMYSVAIQNNWTTADYATYQKALAQGAKNPQDKIITLRTAITKYTSSTWLTTMQLELATTYMATDNYNLALPYLNSIMAGTSPTLKSKAALNLGICYYNTNSTDAALAQYKSLLSTYPNSPEADDAQEYIEKIYNEQNNANAYAAYMRSIGKPLSVSKEDSLTFRAAERYYNNGDATNAITSLSNYLTTFATGSYTLTAQYYLAQLYYTKKDYTNAITYYEIVAQKGVSKFYENATLQTAKLYYFEKNNFVKSEQYFKQLLQASIGTNTMLEAQRGYLRSLYNQQKFTDAQPTAQALLGNKAATIDDKVLSNLTLAQLQQQAANYTAAIAYYKNVLPLNKANFAAEARYYIALCYYLTPNLPIAEKQAFEVVNKSGSYGTWVTKAYILLADVYYAQADYFNAKATLQSVIASTTILLLKTEAQQKLDKVVAAEKANSKIIN